MKTKNLFVLFFLFTIQFGYGQLSDEYFDVVDSLIETTPQISLCKKDGKEDMRFFTKTPEKYSDYKQEFIKAATDAFIFSEKSHFSCSIEVEINCEGKAGNYSFSIEPRTFTLDDYNNFVKLIALVEKLKQQEFKPAIYLGENVNSKAKFRLAAKEGKPILQ